MTEKTSIMVFLREIIKKIDKIEEKIEKLNYLFENENLKYLETIICRFKEKTELEKDMKKDFIKKIFFGIFTFFLNIFLLGLIVFLVKIIK